jgi:peptidyl-prolyl cis-trans isomerase SurA
MKRSLCLIVAFLALALAAPPATAQQRIAALVNDEVISVLDIENRVRLTITTSGLADTQENRQRLRGQALRGLIEEKLQLQEAARMGVFASDREVADAIDRIEQANRLPKGQIATILSQAGLGLPALEQQLRPAIAWQKLLQRRTRAQIHVADEEVDELLARLQARQGAPEFMLSEIFLPIDNPDQDEEIRQTALSLIQQMQRGTPFPAIAQQFSRSASASVGGDLGWVQEGQLDPELDAAIRELNPGEVSTPIRTPGGYYIFGLRDRRRSAGPSPDDAVLALTQLVFPAKGAQEAAAAQQLAQTARAGISDCRGLARLAGELRIAAPAEPKRLRLAEVNPAIRDAVRGLRAGQTSEPIRAGETLVVLVVCEREEPPSMMPSRENAEEMLVRQRLQLLARRYLRDLRRQANVEIRG